MNSKNLVLTLIICFWTTLLVSQDKLYYQDYEWKQNYSSYYEKSDFGKDIIQQIEVIEFSLEGDGFYEYYLYHNVEIVYTEAEIEANNKVYIQLEDDAELIEARARVVNNSKTELLLNQSDILSSYDEELGVSYKYFAVKGIDVGSIIDVYYVLKKPANYNGICKYFQSEYPINHYSFKLISPENLEFVYKVYNDSASFVKSSIEGGRNCWTLERDSISALVNEDLAPYRLLLKKYVYKLDENTASNKRDMSAYGYLSQNIYRNTYSGKSKADIKALEKLYKMSAIGPDDDEETIVRKIENTIKENINLSPNVNTYSSISTLLKGRQSSSFGFVKLLANLLQKANIRHELVLTCDQETLFMDPEFESYHALQDYLIYLSDLEAFIVPDKYEYRLGITPYEYAGGNGLFIKEVSIGDYVSGIGEVRKIPTIPYQDVYHNHDIYVRFEDNFSISDIQFKQSSSAYYAILFQPYIEQIETDHLKVLFEEMIQGYFAEFISDDWKYSGGTSKDIGVNPFILDCKIKTSELAETAGNKILFAVGNLIGPQVEVYSEEERRLPIHDQFKRTFDRTIKVEIPDGYAVRNLDDLNFMEEYLEDGKQYMKFESTAIIEKNIIRIELKEYYNKIDISLEEYAQYRKVVNSAADFNKVKLIFEQL